MPVDLRVDEPVVIRQQGDTPVYPVPKEVLGFEKRLKRVEDVRVPRRRATPRTQERVGLHREAITVERDTAPQDPEH